MEKQRPLIGIIAAEAEYIFFTRSLEYMQEELFAAGMDAAIFSSLMMSGSQEYDAAENSVYDLIDLNLLDGIIIFPSSINDVPTREKLIERIRRDFKGPVISYDSQTDCFANQEYNYEPAAEMIISHLMDQHGVKTIDYIGGPVDPFHDSMQRYFVKSMKKRGYDIPEKRIHHGPDWAGDFSVIVDEIIANGLPDAVVCCSDLTAVQVLAAFAEKGVNVPDDLLLTGFNQKEPYGTDYINITSALRDPTSMARNAARYIIAKVRGGEYVPEREDSLVTLSPGHTCGCRRLNIGTLCKEALGTMTVMQQNGVDSYYNFMSEDMIAAETFQDFLWKVNWYTHFLGDFNGFWMCFNDQVMHNAVPDPGFTDRICLSLQRMDGKGSVDMLRKFPREQLLPAIFEKRDKPAAFLFTSLHFMGVNYGYVALSYGDSGRIYDKSYVKWLRSVTCALEKQRRHILYNDAVTDAQVRDSLTGLLNMRGYTRIMTERCGRFNDPSRLLRIISIDVENLKGINDTYGYAEGDRVLSSLGVALSNAAGDSDIVVRVSGDEFFIAGIIDKNSVDDVPNRLQNAMNSLNSHDSDYGVNIYTAAVSSPITDKSILEKLPYDAAYQRTLAKDNHTKMHKTSAEAAAKSFDPEERKNVIRLLNENLFTYHFQPIVNARTGEIYAYEALMRSDKDLRLSPMTILTHAEALDRMHDVEKCTMFNTLRFALENRQLLSGKLLFINSIPACTLPDPDFEQLHQLYGSVMKNVVVEFTEQTEASSEQLRTLLERSQRCGFQIAIDDYGTGYSNISNLLNFMPNVVKIDRSLIMNIHKDKRKKHFTRNIIDYAHDNNFMALAEGVELAEELQTVIAMGVDLIQGYYTAKPSADIVPAINPDIAKEIVECNRQTENRRPKKTYFPGDEHEISLMALDLDGYTDIIINKPEYTLTGNSNYTSEMTIRAKDNTDCRIDLAHINVKNENAGAAIVVGQNSTMTLNIIGEVNVTGGIYVPAGSTLKITGGGTLYVYSASTQTYAIGSGSTADYGNIEINMSGEIRIHLDSEKSVAIGGRSSNGSHIYIKCRNLFIEQMGKKTLGIGSMMSDADIVITESYLSIVHHSKYAMGIGSFSDPCRIFISDGSASFSMSGLKTGGIGSFYSCGGSIELRDMRLVCEFRAKEILGIGADKQFGEIIMTDCTFNANIEGAQSVTIGSEDCDGTVAVRNCSGDITVSSEHKTLLGVKEENLLMENSNIVFRD